jgi:hypothetical protein
MATSPAAVYCIKRSLGWRANQSTRRGEYTIALNCTITKAMAKAMPVNAIIPEATAERHACADVTDKPNVYDDK